MKRIAFFVLALAVVAVAFYWLALRGSSTPTAEAQPTEPVAQIGEGKTAILVAGDGRLLGPASASAQKSQGKSTTKNAKGNGQKAPPRLPVLPLKQPPKNGRQVRGHVLEEVHVLAAAPSALREYMAKAGYGKIGVEVETTSGIEIRFGDDREAVRKWEAAAAMLADPSVTLLSYVDVTAPSRPATGGEAHELAPLSGK
ncbi:MAG: hypothetical protein JSS68_20495 [Actinobacteria bacterium]|nr:hypothetical protein [Actinomycetota bacterium]